MEKEDNTTIIINGKPIDPESQEKLDSFLESFQQGESDFFDELYQRNEGSKEDENH